MTPAAALAAILEMLPLVAVLVALWAHWRVDRAEARLAETRLQLFGLVETMESWARIKSPFLSAQLMDSHPEIFDGCSDLTLTMRARERKLGRPS